MGASDVQGRVLYNIRKFTPPYYTKYLGRRYLRNVGDFISDDKTSHPVTNSDVRISNVTRNPNTNIQIPSALTEQK